MLFVYLLPRVKGPFCLYSPLNSNYVKCFALHSKQNDSSVVTLHFCYINAKIFHTHLMIRLRDK